MPSSLARFDIRQVWRKVLVFLLAWLVVNVVFLVAFVRPRAQELDRLDLDSQPRLRALKQREREVERREAFVASLEQARSDLEELRGEWLGTRGRQMVPVQLELSRLAQQFNINLEEVRYQNSDLPEEGLERFAMILPLEGGYGNLRRFIQAVETSKRFLVLERVALGQSLDGGVLLQLNVTLATYFDAPYLRKRLELEKMPAEVAPSDRPGPRPVERQA